MADIELVIKIPEKAYENCMKYDAITSSIRKAIQKGTLLPKGHGRLKDIDAIIDSLDASDRDLYCRYVIEENTPTIIEEDKEIEDDERFR